MHDHAEIQGLVVEVDLLDSSEQHRESVAPLAVGDDVRRARLRDQAMGRDRERGLGRNDGPVPGRRHVATVLVAAAPRSPSQGRAATGRVRAVFDGRLIERGSADYEAARVDAIFNGGARPGSRARCSRRRARWMSSPVSGSRATATGV